MVLIAGEREAVEVEHASQRQAKLRLQVITSVERVECGAVNDRGGKIEWRTLW